MTVIRPVTLLSEEERQLCKTATDDHHVVETDETIFYVQGGGQPTDTGTMSLKSEQSGATFDVVAARATADERILHFGSFKDSSKTFSEGDTVLQEVDVDKRILHSRIHTAGHVVGVAVHLLPDLIQDVEDGKAQHYPGAASVEFTGLIDSKHKDAIQAKVDELVARDVPVNVVYWDEKTMREKVLGALSDAWTPNGELTRAVEIAGGAYMCGGTQVKTLKECGKITVRKISRSKGVSRISYAVD